MKTLQQRKYTRQEPDQNSNTHLLCKVRSGLLLVYRDIWVCPREKEIGNWDIGDWDIGDWDIGDWDIGDWDIGDCDIWERDIGVQEIWEHGYRGVSHHKPIRRVAAAPH
jgi:hypothetical protein